MVQTRSNHGSSSHHRGSSDGGEQQQLIDDGMMNHDNSSHHLEEEDQHYYDEEFTDEVNFDSSNHSNNSHRKTRGSQKDQLVRVNSVDDLFRLESENKAYDDGPSMQQMAELWLEKFQHQRIHNITEHSWKLFFLLQIINFILTFWGNTACSNVVVDTSSDATESSLQCRRWFWLLLHIPLDLLLTLGPAHFVEEKQHGLACMMGYTLALLYIILLDIPFLALAPDPLLDSPSSDAIISFESIMYLAMALLYGYADLGEGAQFQLIPLKVDQSTHSHSFRVQHGGSSGMIDSSKNSHTSILKNPLPTTSNNHEKKIDDGMEEELLLAPQEHTRWRVDLRGFSTRAYFWREFRGLRTRKVTNWGTLEYVEGDEFELKIHPIIAAPWRRRDDYHDDYGLPLKFSLQDDSDYYNNGEEEEDEEDVVDNRRQRLLTPQQSFKSTGSKSKYSLNDGSYGSYPTFASDGGGDDRLALEIDD